jgi:hypothetical protein
MDPYNFAQRQGQVIKQPGVIDRPEDEAGAENILELVLHAFSDKMTLMTTEAREAVTDYVKFANAYLAERRVVATGNVDGSFALVFEDGHAIPLATTEPAKPPRAENTIAITMPKEQKMKGMSVVDTSVPMTGPAVHARRKE